MRLNRRQYLAAVAIITLAAVLLQLAQPEDDTFLLLYFTTDSAIALLAGYAGTALLLGSPLIYRIATAGESGVLLSGVVFWAAIFPFNGLGSALMTQSANVALHALVPLVVVVGRFMGMIDPGNVRDRIVSLWYPVSYLLLVTVPAWTGLWRQPYTFLALDAGLPAITVSIVFIAAAYVLVGLGIDRVPVIEVYD